MPFTESPRHYNARTLQRLRHQNRRLGEHKNLIDRKEHRSLYKFNQGPIAGKNLGLDRVQRQGLTGKE
jgi:hypothetical protein